MRKFVVYIGFLVCAIAVQAQDPETGLYRSFFGEDTTVWNAYEFRADWNYSDLTLFIVGDTVAEDTLACKKIYYKDYIFFRRDDGTWDYEYKLLLYGIIRENRNTGQLWLKRNELIGWRIIADMSLSYEDSFRGHRVSDITTDSLGRKIIKLGESNVLIEGVGPVYYEYSLGYAIVCVWHNDDLQYSLSSYNNMYISALSRFNAIDCRLQQSGIQEVEHAAGSIRIYPNPCFNHLNVDCDKKCSVSIVDSYGRVVVSTRTIDEYIDVSGWQKGVYLVKIECEQQVLVRKIIKL